MIRFVYIGSQITDLADEEAREFAIYDTVTDKFISVDENYTFDSYEELESLLPIKYGTEDRNRILNIIPDWYKNGDKPPWLHEE